MKRAGADFHVVRLQDHAPLLRPVVLQGEDQLLERARRAADFHGGLSDPKERASIRRGRAAVRPAAAAGLASLVLAPKTRVRMSAATRNPACRCQTHANGAIIHAARTNVVQTTLHLLSNCLICRIRSLARTLQCHTAPPASHIRHLDPGGELYPFPEAI